MAGFLLCAVFALWRYSDRLGEDELPVITEFTNLFNEGISGLHLLSKEAVNQFYSQSSEERTFFMEESSSGSSANPSAFSPEQTLPISLSWNRDAILRKLKEEGFSSGKRKAAGRILDYVDQHKFMVLQDMRLTKIPASIKLAQAILESSAGRSSLAKATNNHFGIKAIAGKSARQKIKARRYNDLRNDEFLFREPAIDAYNFHDDHRYDRFEVYKTVGDSYRRHNRLLSQPCKTGNKGCYSWIWEKYQVGNHYDITPVARMWEGTSGIAPKEFFNGRTFVPYYAAAAAGLKMSGYATSPTYHKKLFFLIETYELWRFDLDLIKAVNGKNHPLSDARR